MTAFVCCFGLFEFLRMPFGLKNALKAKKTILFEAAVDYLGFKVDEDGIHMTDKFVQQVKDWPTPTSGKELATALGFFWVLQRLFAQVCGTDRGDE